MPKQVSEWIVYFNDGLCTSKMHIDAYDAINTLEVAKKFLRDNQFEGIYKIERIKE